MTRKKSPNVYKSGKYFTKRELIERESFIFKATHFLLKIKLDKKIL